MNCKLHEQNESHIPPYFEKMIRRIRACFEMRLFVCVEGELRIMATDRPTRPPLRWNDDIVSGFLEACTDAAIVTLDRHGRFGTWNTGARSIFGYLEEEMADQPFSVLFPESDRARGVPRVLLQNASARGCCRTEGWRTHKGGGLRWVAETLTALREADGTVIGFVLIANDNSSRRWNEENFASSSEHAAINEAESSAKRLQFLAEAGMLLAGSLDYRSTLSQVAHLVVPYLADWCVVHIIDEDDQARQLVVAHTDPDKVRWAEELQRRFPPDPSDDQGVWRVLRTGEPQIFPYISDEMIEAGAENEEHLALLRRVGFHAAMVLPLVARGRTLGAISFIAAESSKDYTEADITLGRELCSQAALALDNARFYREAQLHNASLEQRVRERTADLERALAELESFSYAVSHDLRAPLRSMDGFSLALLEDYGDRVDEVGRDYLERVRGAAQRMGRLIDALLELSRVTRAELQAVPVNLSRLARSIMNDLIEAEPERVVECDIQEGLIAHGDPHLLQIALDNLLSNAWKFSAGKTPTRIEVGRNESDDEWVFFVRDHGVGFDMSYIDKVFAPFQRLHSAEAYPGTGVGLVTVARIIERHGGRIWAEGQPDHGAEFHFTLPSKVSE